MSIPTINRRQDRSRGRAGFTLIEIMVVVAIIGLLLTFVAPNVWNRMREANVTGTQAKMTNLRLQIDFYRNHYNAVPDRLDDLLQPSEKNFGDPYIENEDDLKDAWGNDFHYEKLSSTKYDIISYGADGMEGGENDDADLHSRKDQMPR
ncbi:MAG: type II secretion system protein GspG [Planctomycetota bacterium]|jgi:general secretion pathway protein G